jgi:hypothetical protein
MIQIEKVAVKYNPPTIGLLYRKAFSKKAHLYSIVISEDLLGNSSVTL